MSQKQAFVDIGAGRLITGWTVHSGSVYKATVDETFRGRRLDVIGLRLAGGSLTRVESIALVVAGTYFFDPDSTVASPVYARLTDSGSPVDLAVYGILGFHFSNVPVVQPTLGPDKLIDGALDVWGSSVELTHWTFAASGAVSGSTFIQDSVIFAEGTYSAKLASTISDGGFMSVSAAVAVATVAGARYRFSGYYRTDDGNSPYVTARVALSSAAATQILEDGRTTTTTAHNALSNTSSEWRRFIFDVVAPDTTLTPRLYIQGETATGTGTVRFDGLKLQRIWRFEEYEPRLSYESLPVISEGRRDIFYQRWFTGQGSLTLLNGSGYDEDLYGGYLEELFGGYEFTNAQVHVWIGGRFQGGNEILKDGAWFRRWNARDPNVTWSRAMLQLDAPNSILSEMLPNADYDVDDATIQVAPNDQGRPIPLPFGVVSNARPTRYGDPNPDNAEFSHAGAFTFLDQRYLLEADGVHWTDLYLYEDAEAAANKDVSRRIVPRTVTFELSEGFGILPDPGPIRITDGENDRLDFVANGVTLAATITTGLYHFNTGSVGLASIVQDAMRAATGGANVDVVFNIIDETYTISYTGAGTFQFLLGTGALKHRSVLPTMGFVGDANLTGAVTYTGAAVLSPWGAGENLRGDITGYRDDSLGTYTGTPYADVELPGDVLYFMLRLVLGVPAEQIDIASVAAVRAGADALSVFLGATGDERHEFGQIVEWIENSNGIEPLFDGDQFLLRKRDNSVPADILTITDSDVIGEPEWWQSEIFSIVRIEYGQDASTGKLLSATITEDHTNATIAAWCATAKARLGRDKSKGFRTYLPSTVAYADELIVNSTTPRRMCRLTVKGSALRKIPGDKVSVALTTLPGATPVTMRILNVEHNVQSWESTLELAEVLVGVTSGW